MPRVQAHAPARVGLLGNPSDLYAGRGLGFALDDLGVEVTLTSAPVSARPNALLDAGWRRFDRLLRSTGRDPDARPYRLAFASNVPFQSGLSGSSALLIAALRAWSRWFDLPLAPALIAEEAWRAEVDELHIRAGPLDRIVQAFGGLLAMDFADPFGSSGTGGVRAALDPALLPPLLIAWHGAPGAGSGDVHAPVYERWKAGDTEVEQTMQALARNADDGCRALLRPDRDAILRCVDRNFDLRSALFPIAPADRALVDLGRALGAAAKFPGSGGSVLFACRSHEHRARVEAECRRLEATTLLPRVAPVYVAPKNGECP